jgi:hypothetical protein
VDPRGARSRPAVVARPGRLIGLDLIDLFLIVEFTLVSVASYVATGPANWGADAIAYWDAAHRWITGGDPYANLGGLVFAAPPPTLAVLAVFATLPLEAFELLLTAASIASAVYLVRRLHLPPWYLLFPPIVEAVVIGNPNVIVVALLVAALPATDALASFLKLYALLPIALLWRRRSVVLVAAILVVTAPFLPWPAYVGHAAELLNVLDVQSSGGRSALAIPILIPFTLIALVLLGRHRAAWLVVPALWPSTQFHYNVLALPAASRLMAAILAIPLPGAPAVAIIAEASYVLWRRRMHPTVGSLTAEAG